MDLQGRPEDVIELWTRNGACKIELLSGDITRLPREEKVDIIMVSAFPGDYAAMGGTVIGALKRNLGISVMDLSMKKELDLRVLFSCWLSKPIEEGTAPYKKLLCFEKKRGSHMSISAQISEMFRVFVPVFNNQDHSVITPLLATGHQGQSESMVCGTMVEAAIQWIHAGLPLRNFKIVIYGAISQSIEKIFAALKKKYLAKNKQMKNRIFKKNYDIYISYNPVDQQYMQKIKDSLQEKKMDIKLYTETKHFNKDKVWQDDIFKVMVSCKRIIAILSPAFMQSTECLEQYNMAMCCNRLLGVDVLAPFYIDTISTLPSYMGLVQWIDCRVRKEGDTLHGKIQTACTNIVVAIEGDGSGDNKEQAFPSVDSSNKLSSEKFDFDVFISYSHKNPSHAEKLLEAFNKVDPDCKVFYDRSSLTTGTNWQNMLYQSVGECRYFIALLSSTYISSTVCMEEYNLALARYLCKDKDLMLIPLLIESVTNIPPYMSTKQMMRAVKDYDETATELARSVSEWMKINATKRPTDYTIQEPVDIQIIMSAQRCEDVKKQYRLVKTKREPNFERIKPLVLPSQEIESIDTTKVDIAVSYANDATHLAGSFCVMMDRLYPNFNISIHSDGDHKRYSALDTSRKIVLFVSKEFLENEHHMQELHLALNRQRTNTQNIVYLIQTTLLSGRPFFPRILPYNVACIDSVWQDFQNEFSKGSQTPDKNVVTVFGKKSRLQHASTFFCRRAEYYALKKAVEDVLESLLKENDEKDKRSRMLVNVKEIELMTNGNSKRDKNNKVFDETQQPGVEIEYQHVLTVKSDDKVEEKGTVTSYGKESESKTEQVHVQIVQSSDKRGKVDTVTSCDKSDLVKENKAMSSKESTEQDGKIVGGEPEGIKPGKKEEKQVISKTGSPKQGTNEDGAGSRKGTSKSCTLV